MTGRHQERAGIPGVAFTDPARAGHYTGLQNIEVTLPEQLDIPARSWASGSWSTCRTGGLYDLSSDLAEHHDLYAKFPERVAEMEKALARWQEGVARGATVQPSTPPDIDVPDSSS